MQPRSGIWPILIALVIVAGIAGACSEYADPVAPATDGGTPSQPHLTSGPDVRLTPSCGGTDPTPYTGSMSVTCVELWGQSTTIPVNIPTTFTCKPWGPVSGQMRALAMPANALLYPLYLGADEFATAAVQDASNFTFAITGHRPTNPTNHTAVRCNVAGSTPLIFPVIITGTAPTLTSVSVYGNLDDPVPPGKYTELIPHYYDSYGYADKLEPIPLHSWSSLTPAIASVDPATGFVYGIAPGTATIQLSAEGKVGTANVTVAGTGCSLATTPTGAVNTFQGGRVDLSATAHCFGGAILPAGNWTWPITGPVSVWNDNSQNSLVHIVGEGPGTATTKVCTPAGSGQVCSPTIAFKLYASRIASSLDGTMQTPGINANGSIVFTITNVGPIAGTSNVFCEATGVVACNSVTPTSVALQPNESKTVTANWSSGTTTGIGGINVSSTGGGHDGISFTIDGGPLTASIFGPSAVRPSVQCEWDGDANGGTAPYTYNWRNKPFLSIGTDQVLVFTNPGAAFTLYLDVTDALGATVTISKAVTVSSGAPACLL